MRQVTPWALVMALLAAPPWTTSQALGQSTRPEGRRLLPHVIVPQLPDLGARGRPRVEVRAVEAVVVLRDQLATTTLDFELHNPSGGPLEAQILVPLPDRAVVRGFTFQGTAREPSAELLPKEQARKIYDQIVARLRDPALLEFLGYDTLRSSVFPVEAGGTQKVRLTYEELLRADGARVDYLLPRSESLEHDTPWRIRATVESTRGVATVYSPSHQLVTRAAGARTEVEVSAEAQREPGAFLLSYLQATEPVTTSLVAYPDPASGGGYFLLLGGLPGVKVEEPSTIRREVTLVVDRSGSMHGAKLAQAREAALQVLAGLDDGETFNVIVYNEAVDRLAATPLAKNPENLQLARSYLQSVQPRGGTNLHDALLESLRQRPANGALPLVLFLTDGLPTIGQTAESSIRALATGANPHKKRVFTFGVGTGVNTPLLENVAFETRGTATFILPEESVELKVASVFRKLSGPLLADPLLEAIDDAGNPAPGRVREMMPTRLPDLFEGDQLIAFGQYVGDSPIRFRLRGNYRGTERAFEFAFSLGGSTTANAHIPRLWASRKIAMLLDAVRALGASSPTGGTALTAEQEPKLKELVDEIVRLSVQFGVLTEYTAFLAREGSNLANAPALRAALEERCRTRALSVRSGRAGLNQELNLSRQKLQGCSNKRNAFLDENLATVTTSTVQQINGDTYYQRAGCWVDSRLVREDVVPRRVIRFGSDEFRKLAGRLATAGKQSTFALRGDVLLLIDGDPVLIRAPRSE